ncbi:MAG: efflux transporter outer membrane subunit [Pedobacter sp.]|nr:efflux transporter outer membrane subunit [Pedobacter sp.]
MMRKSLLASSISACLLLSACSLAPVYNRPDAKTDANFRQFGDTKTERSAEQGNEQIKDRWWEDLGDPVLNGLVDDALKNNQDLLRATARVDQFAATLQTTRSAYFPQIGYAAGAGRDKIPPLGATTRLNAGLTADWEIDLFGRVRSASDAAKAELLSSEENRQAVILSLVTSVAAGYVNLRSLDLQLEIAINTAKTREDALDLFRRRHEGGVVSGVEYAQQESEYEAARAAIPDARQAIAIAENNLAVLTGRSSAQIPRGKAIDQLRLAAPPEGLPSELLERRPDLRSAEQAMIAANARIGEARSQYFPQISLTGLFGGTSNDFDNLFDAPSRTWRYAGSITGPIFRFGAIKGQVNAAHARQRELLAVYQSAIQNAFADTDRSLSQVQTTQERLEAQTRQVGALSRYAKLARMRYDGGYTSYIDVLDAERSLFTVQLSHAQSQADTVIAVINLYKALGGSWIEHADPQRQQEQQEQQQEQKNEQQAQGAAPAAAPVTPAPSSTPSASTTP